ncbi:MAG: hypothetical protein DCC49_12745, partial [Acidobacteria bacterium]
MGIFGRREVARLGARIGLRRIAVAASALGVIGFLVPAPVAAGVISTPAPIFALVPGPAVAEFASPASESLVSGAVELRVAALDNTGIRIPGEFFYANPATPETHLGQLIPSSDPPSTSAAGEEVTLTAVLDTRELPDADYRIAAKLTDTEGNQSVVTETIRTDNTAPRVVMTAPHPGPVPTVTQAYEVTGHVDDANLASWSLRASGPGWVSEITSGTMPVSQGSIGTYLGSMAPPGYFGPVD